MSLEARSSLTKWYSHLFNLCLTRVALIKVLCLSSAKLEFFLAVCWSNRFLLQQHQEEQKVTQGLVKKKNAVDLPVIGITFWCSDSDRVSGTVPRPNKTTQICPHELFVLRPICVCFFFTRNRIVFSWVKHYENLIREPLSDEVGARCQE